MAKSSNIGGIVATANSSLAIRNASFKGVIKPFEKPAETTNTVTVREGGIVGYLANSPSSFPASIANSSFSGYMTVYGDYVYAGGIIGYVSSCYANIANTYINGKIKCPTSGCDKNQKTDVIAATATSLTNVYETYWNPSVLPDLEADDVKISNTTAKIDATCLKYDDSDDHIIETISSYNSPELLNRLRYNIGVLEVGGVASPNLPYAEDYRTWTTYKDENGVLWPVIDLESPLRYSGL